MVVLYLVFALHVLFATTPVGQAHQDHKHYWPEEGKEGNLFHDDGFIWDWDHLKEDALDSFKIDLGDDLSEAEKDFYYFQMHDIDGDGKLDGLEILGAMNHVTDISPDEKEDKDDDEKMEYVMRLRKQKRWNAKFMHDSRIIDDILKEDDVNSDGFLSYIEFIHGRRAKANIAAS